MTKAQLRKIYQQWAAEEIEAIELIEAVGRYLGKPQVPAPVSRALGTTYPGKQNSGEEL